MSTITFRGAYLRMADLRHKKEAGTFTRLHFTADLSEPIMEAMEWPEIPDCMSQCHLDGLLSSRNLVLTPNQSELRNHEIRLECTEVGEFQLFRLQEKESTRTELRFVARVIARGAIGLCEEYLRNVGTSQGALKITYEEQGELPMEEPEKPKRGKKTNGVPLDAKQLQAGETAEYAD